MYLGSEVRHVGVIPCSKGGPFREAALMLSEGLNVASLIYERRRGLSFACPLFGVEGVYR